MADKKGFVIIAVLFDYCENKSQIMHLFCVFTTLTHRLRGSSQKEAERI
jgi:hypothetical protein